MKKLLKIVKFFVLIFISQNSFSQNLFRSKFIENQQDTFKIDTFPLVPNSITFSDSTGKKLPDSLFFVNFVKSTVFFKNKEIKKVKISYRTFPFYFSKPFFHRDTTKILPPRENKLNQNYSVDNQMFNNSSLQKSGSLIRGIQFGSQQDAATESQLNLQLSGNIAENIAVNASLIDNNIPFQPDGNTQNIQEFDQVFIEISRKNTQLTAGDFDILSPKSDFLKLNRKMQGAKLKTQFSMKKNKIFKTQNGVTISKGTYNRLIFNGIEGNQGPYKLKGAKNETQIIILAGSEKVFIDGKILKRGQENDYVIDYNTAEIIFTIKNFITKDSRIIVEFEYTEKFYNRFTYFIFNELQIEKTNFRFHFFSENDDKNKPYQILSDSDKVFLKQIGDSTDNLPKNLAVPQQKILFSTGISVKKNKHFFDFETAFSQFDKNLFSTKDKQNDNGIALKIKELANFLVDTTFQKFFFEINYRFIHKNFSVLERIDYQEFERNWNLTSNLLKSNEHFADFSLNYSRKEIFKIFWKTEILSQDVYYQGIRNGINFYFNNKIYEGTLNADFLFSKTLDFSTKFATFSLFAQKKFTFFSTGFRTEMENNIWQSLNYQHNTTQKFKSYRFFQTEIFCQKNDTNFLQFFLNYKNRVDWLENSVNQLKINTLSNEIRAEMFSKSTSQEPLRFVVTYRNLSVIDSSVSEQKPENTLLSGVEKRFFLFKKRISLNLIYEIGSGLEPERKFSFIEMPTGMGQYRWVDYNSNNIKELDEFEISPFSEEARFVRRFFPTEKYTKMISNRMEMNFFVNKFFKRFSNLFATKFFEKKTKFSIFPNFVENKNAFQQTISLQNTLFFNRESEIFGINYVLKNDFSQIFLANGFENQNFALQSAIFRVNFSKKTILTENFSWGNKNFLSETMKNRNYKIALNENCLLLEIQGDKKFSYKFSYSYLEQKNFLATEKSFRHRFELEGKYTNSLFSMFSVRCAFLQIAYNSAENSPLAVAMLEGFYRGKNFFTNVAWQKSLTEVLRFEFFYEIRYSQNHSIIQTGNVRLRADF